ncbi:MAG: hypothetical protein ABSD20_18190 [Terriglobales bacterium]
MICIIGAPAALGQIVNPGFEAGNTGFTSGYAFGNVSEPGTYTVGTSSAAVAGSFGDWQAFGDHTTGTGMMMIVNGGTDSGALVWSETVPVSPKTNYRFSFWGATLNADSGSPASIQVKINGASVGKGNVFPGASPPAGGAWTRFTVTWNSGPATTATISLFDLNTSTGWNDFALDDISLTGEPVKAEKK